MQENNKQIALIVNEKHAIHQAPDQWYPEKPERIDLILQGLNKSELFEKLPARHFSDRWIKEVHDSTFVNYLKKMSTIVKPGELVYPKVFPIRNLTRLPSELSMRSGYYAIDKFTPLTSDSYPAARAAVDCALTAAKKILNGYHFSYALIRPPGHHAESDHYGGFCYLNSTSIAANYLSHHGKVAILDIDYHPGNGTQQIFYNRSDVLTISIHGDPNFNYPCFSGWRDEKGAGQGKGYNMNIPLPRVVDGAEYQIALKAAIRRIARYKPRFLVIALGFDTSKGDAIGRWTLEPADFEINGKSIGEIGLPTLVVQEGGYGKQPLGLNAFNFFKGLWNANRSD
ncbi:MAG: histone deacetylase family protein [Chloroflexi bacterium]|nr:histone deacetylase family protein [Chloroflexota bacterium]